MMPGARAVSEQGKSILRGLHQDEQLTRVAARWVVCMQGEPDERIRRQCDTWRAACSEHERAYRRAERAWQLSAALADDPAFNIPVPRVRRRAGVWLAAACLMVGVLLGVQSGMRPWMPSSTADFQTGAAEVRTLHLDDGSEVVLGVRSAIDVAYSSEERRVVLLRGEAVFTPSPRAGEESRPFVVQAGPLEGEALGTRFMVRHDTPEGGWLGVLEHRVAVHGVALDDEPLMLVAGESAVFQDGAVQPDTLDPVAESDWSRGVLVFRNQPLKEVAGRLHQYGAPRTLFIGSAHDDTPVSAVFRLDNLQQAWPTLSDGLDVRVVRLPGLQLAY